MTICRKCGLILYNIMPDESVINESQIVQEAMSKLKASKTKEKEEVK